jgi:predicted TIM-barrel enzyme
MRNFDTLGKKKVVIGMVHLLPLPGTPFYEAGNMERALDKAVADATALDQGGADGCLIQTVDRIYSPGDDVDYARVAAMAAIVKTVSDATRPEFQIGVQIMVNALKASLAVANVCGGSFLRCTALVGATLSASGVVEAKPLEFLNYSPTRNVASPWSTSQLTMAFSGSERSAADRRKRRPVPADNGTASTNTASCSPTR